MLVYEVAYLSGEVRLVRAQPVKAPDEAEQIFDLLAIGFEWMGYFEGEDE